MQCDRESIGIAGLPHGLETNGKPFRVTELAAGADL